MASACVNSNIALSPDNFPPATYPSYGWLSPRISFRHEEDDAPEPFSGSSSSSKTAPAVSFSDPSPEIQDPPVDFEFQLEDPVAMLPADELFSDGKLVPLRVTNVKPASSCVDDFAEISWPEAAKSCRKMETEVSTGTADLYSFSPKAPRCSSRWRVLLGLKKLYHNPTTHPKSETHKAAASSSSSTSSNYSNPNSKSLKHFLHRRSKCCACNESDNSLSLPLLKDSDCESVSISSSRLSLSSSSSSHDHEDLPRLSLDSEKPNPNPTSLQAPNPNPFVLNRNPNQNPPRMKLVKPRSENENPGATPGRMISGGVSADSPRMNSSGKIVFHSLERSSSSPSSFNGGLRFKQRGRMERSYSVNVRITPVLNVPLCSLRGSSSKSVSVFGFGQLFSSSPQKRDGSSKSHHHPSTVPGTRKTDK